MCMGQGGSNGKRVSGLTPNIVFLFSTFYQFFINLSFFINATTNAYPQRAQNCISMVVLTELRPKLFSHKNMCA